MPVLLNGYLKGLIGLTRHNEISAEFAFRGSNLFLVSKRCLSAKSAARSHSFLLTATVPMRSMWTVMPPDPPSAFVSSPLYWLRASTAVKPLTIHFRPEIFTAIVVHFLSPRLLFDLDFVVASHLEDPVSYVAATFDT